jgi:benzoyl-CoA reductase/2-hydroxyglutaryl-CoA dehydratase subunit BcrC/BadD/HgdB
MIRRYRIDGVIAMLVGSCRKTAYMLHKWSRLKAELEKVGLNTPLLGIEVDMVDPRTYSEALTKDRIRAFMETVDVVKKAC